VKEIMDGKGFINTVEIINPWPLHAQDGEVDFADMVRANFEEKIQGLSLGLLTDTMLPWEVELYLASLRKEAKQSDLQIFWEA
jgi:hypothetical protein